VPAQLRANRRTNAALVRICLRLEGKLKINIVLAFI
jgi:hypothetical protein